MYDGWSGITNGHTIPLVCNKYSAPCVCDGLQKTTRQPFYSVPTALNGGCYALGPCVCLFVRRVAKRTIMYSEETDGPRSPNFYARMRVDKVRSPADFRSNRPRPWPLRIRSKIRIEYIEKFTRHKRSSTYVASRFVYLYLILAYSKVQSQGRAHFDC